MTTNTAPRPRRRFLRFSLRTLLIGMTVAGCAMGWLGWKVHQARKQQQAMVWVQKMGGTVYYVYPTDRIDPYGNNAPPPTWLTRLFGVDFVYDVSFVSLADTQVLDLTPLAAVTRLRSLDLEGTQVSDLTPLAGMTSLQELDLYGTSVSDLTPLAKMIKMRRLYLDGTSISDVSPLAGMTELRWLNLRETQVTDLTPLVGLDKVSIYLDEDQQVTIPPELEGRVERFAKGR